MDNGFSKFVKNGDYVLDPFVSNQRFFIQSNHFESLYEHQVECIKWLWDLHKENKGGILGGMQITIN
jgi:hypothetical protein